MAPLPSGAKAFRLISRLIVGPISLRLRQYGLRSTERTIPIVAFVLVLLLATWALLKAAEEGNRRLLFLSCRADRPRVQCQDAGALTSCSHPSSWCTFSVRLSTGRVGSFTWEWRRSLWSQRLCLGSLLYELTPAEGRPFVGSSHQNSMLELVVGHNAMNRFVSPAKYFTADTHGQGTLRAANAGTGITSWSACRGQDFQSRLVAALRAHPDRPATAGCRSTRRTGRVAIPICSHWTPPGCASKQIS